MAKKNKKNPLLLPFTLKFWLPVLHLLFLVKYKSKNPKPKEKKEKKTAAFI